MSPPPSSPLRLASPGRRPATASSRRWGPAAAAALLFLLGSGPQSPDASAADAELRAANPETERPRDIKRASRLVANSANGVRYVVTGVCEAAGIRQIAEVLKHAAHEEMWAFLPRANGGDDCQWHEIGRQEEAGRDGAYVRVDMAYLEGLVTNNAEIRLVHFHPLRFFDCAADPSCPKEAVPEQSGLVDKRWITDLLFSMPSPSDVHFMMDVSSRFHKHHRGRGRIAHKVITPYGVVDYGLTGEGLAKFEYEMYSRSEGRYITWVVASGLADESIEAVVKEHPNGIAAAVRALARSLNTQFLRVEHRPF